MTQIPRTISWIGGIDGTADQGTVFTLTATTSPGPQKIFTTLLSNQATTDTTFALVQPDATKHALINANIGGTLNATWTNPTLFSVVRTRLNGQVTTAHFQCTLNQPDLLPGVTSGSIQFPATCNGEAPTSADINLVVEGPNGERCIVIYDFSG